MDETESIYDLTYRLATHDNPQAAIQLLEQQIAEEPEDARAFALMGIAKWTSGTKSECDALFSRSLELDPEDPNVLAFNGWFLRELERFEEAENLMLRAHQLDPEESEYCLLLAGIRQAVQDWGDAYEWAQKAVDLNPDARTLGFFAMCCGRTARFDEGEQAIRSALEWDATDSELHGCAGLFWLDAGDIPAARRHFRTSVQLDPRPENIRKLATQSEVGGRFFGLVIRLESWLTRKSAFCGPAVLLLSLLTAILSLAAMLFSGLIPVVKLLGCLLVFGWLILGVPRILVALPLFFSSLGRDLLFQTPKNLRVQRLLHLSGIAGMGMILFSLDFENAWACLIFLVVTIATLVTGVIYSPPPKGSRVDDAEDQIE